MAEEAKPKKEAAKKPAAEKKKETAPEAAEKKEKPKEVKPEKTEEKKEAPKKQVKKELPKQPKMDPWTVLKFPHLSEKSTANIEVQNKLVFIVKNRATRKEIKDAVEGAFNVKVVKVNMTSTAKGEKKAYVRLDEKSSAADIATRLGMM